MFPQSSVFRTNPNIDILKELRAFINGATTSGQTSALELTKNCLFLLKTIPAARSAILEYLRNVFDEAAKNYILRLEKEIATGKLPPLNELDEAKLAEIHTVLCSFVSNNAEAWAPIISTWSLELLGEISSRYAGRAHVCPGLNETLQLWMNCRATKTLIDITTQCLSCLMHSNTEACISALLDTSVTHSPNFDWVVAHVGSCFPQTVIVRVLSCGLKDFCQNKSYQQGCESPKLKSVVGILGHLATSHVADIQRALIDLFKWCLQETSFQDGDMVKIQRKATVPYLLQLLTLSSTLLNAISNEITETIPLHVVLKLYHMTDDWCKYFGSPQALQELLVNLILRCDQGGSQIINLLLDCIFLDAKKNNETESKIASIKSSSRELLECILEDVDYSVRYQHYNNLCSTISLLNSLIYDVQEIYTIFLSDELYKSQTAARIITFIGQNNPPILIQAISCILQKSKQEMHLAFLVRVLSNELIDKMISPYSEKGGHFSVAIEQILDRNYIRMNGYSNESSNFDQFWANLLTLLRWEKSGQVFMLKSKCISKALENNLVEITGVFKSNILSLKSALTLCEILDLMDIPGGASAMNPPLQVLLNFVNGAVHFFFMCCKETDDFVRMSGFKRIRSIFRRLCVYSKICRNSTLRLLLERALFSNDSEFFGAEQNNKDQCSDSNKQLLVQNKKISKTIPLTKHSSVYNGGIIGNGKRKSLCVHRPPLDLVSANTEQLIHVIKACCAFPGAVKEEKMLEVFPESLTLVSLMLVQLVSPDVMYNGLPWPEEDFSKVTIERDLLIRRLFNNSPLLWDLLNLVALYRPALCYCSVLIRALTATLMHQWTSMGDQSKSSNTESYKALMNTTVMVIDVMALGQLLPPPLSHVRDVVPFLNSHEIVAILRECIWCYMRDHIPSPALFGLDSNGLHWRDPAVVRPADVYTKTLRIIMQRNINTVGHLYSQMFITLPSNG